MEKVVVEVLLDHYNKTGSLFRYYRNIYHAADSFKIPVDKIDTVLMRLKQDRVAYKYWDKHYGALKIGLYKAFIKKLKIAAKLEAEAEAGGKPSGG